MDSLTPFDVEATAGAVSEALLTIWSWMRRRAVLFNRFANLWIVLLLWASSPLVIWLFYQLFKHHGSIWMLLIGVSACVVTPICSLLVTLAYAQKKGLD